jgi:hypothetical protein
MYARFKWADNLPDVARGRKIEKLQHAQYVAEYRDVLFGLAHEMDAARRGKLEARRVWLEDWFNRRENPLDLAAVAAAGGVAGIVQGIVQPMAARALNPYSPEEIAAANRTARAAGSVGARALVPRYVTETARRGETVLDFGAGKQAAHTLRLREAGLDVTAHEFGANVVAGLHDPRALDRKYDTVMLSNVVNVQPRLREAEELLRMARGLIHDDGRVVFNYPETPRKMTATAQDVENAAGRYFGYVRRVGGTRKAPVWEVRR